jgi:hypothetical protein
LDYCDPSLSTTQEQEQEEEQAERPKRRERVLDVYRVMMIREMGTDTCLSAMPFYTTKNDRLFTKTGSGQTHRKS